MLSFKKVTMDDKEIINQYLDIHHMMDLTFHI